MKFKRPFLLTASIVSTVVVSILLAMLLKTLIIIFQLGFGSLFVTLFGWLTLLELATDILVLWTNIKLISIWNKDHSAFKKKSGLIILAIILNFVLAALAFAINALSIMLTIALVLSASFYIVDFCKESGRVAESNKIIRNNEELDIPQLIQPVDNTPEPIQPIDDIEITSNTSYDNIPNTNIETLEMKIYKLNKMKQDGLLTEEEYTTLIKSYLDNDQ